jgi:ABC-type nitrate/sulfonate/bicarbonate transport system permease component
MSSNWRRSFNGLIGLLGLLLFFEVIASMQLLDTRYFPKPTTALARLFDLVLKNEETSYGAFYEHLQASSIRFIVGVSIAGIFNFLLAIGAGLSEIVKHLSSAIVGFLYPLPKSALFPLFLLLFGLNNVAHIALIAVGAFAIMLPTSIAGLQRLEIAGYLELSRFLRISPLAKLKKVLIPGLMTEFMQSLKLGLSYALVLLLVSEMIVTRQGLGVLLWAAWDQFNFVDLFAIFYFVSFAGLFIFGMFDWLGEKFAVSQRAV